MKAANIQIGNQIIEASGAVLPVTAVKDSGKNITLTLDCSAYYLSFRKNTIEVTISKNKKVNVIN